jgi:hypothetical protein
MAPSTIARQKEWFTTLWVLEKADTKSFAYTLSRVPVARKDGDSKVLQVVAKAAAMEPVDMVELGEVETIGDPHDKVKFDEDCALLEVVKNKT